MKDLKYYTEKIKEKRKQTTWDDFICEIASWYPLAMYKNKGLISIFPETQREGNIASMENYLKQYENQLITQDIYGGDFFDNFGKLFRNSYKPASVNFGNNENSEYSFCPFGVKNAYLSFVVGDMCENVMYSSVVYTNCSNVYDSVLVHNDSHNVYASKGVGESFNVFYSLNIYNSSDIINSSNLIGCHNCIECNDLENSSYYFKNKKYSKEEFKTLKEKYKKQRTKLNFRAKNLSSSDVIGEGIFNSQDIKVGYFVNRLNKGRNVAYIGGGNMSEDFYDTFEAGIDSKDFYGVCNAGSNSHDVYCSNLIDEGSSYIFYSHNLSTCSYCIGCVGLKNRSYCILNKQYTKDEWYIKMDGIFGDMLAHKTLGDFFPGKLNPYNFNDTAAGLIGKFTKQEVEEKGYLWRDDENKVDIPESSDVISIQDLDNYQGYDENNNWRINPEILKVVIKDEKGNCYRIVQMEYDFLLKHSLPLPEIHWMERMKINFGM